MVRLTQMEEWVQQRLKENIRGAITTTAAALEAASVDASIFKVMPLAVVTPQDTEDLKTLVRNINGLTRDGRLISVTPRGSGLGISGGALTQGIVVDMRSGFSWTDKLSEHDKSWWVGSGCVMHDLQEVLEKHHLQFAPYSDMHANDTIGGMVGDNASSDRGLRYGAVVDNIMAIRIIASDGNEYEFGSITGEQFLQKVQQQTFEGYLYRELDKLIEANREILQLARPKVRQNSAGYQLWRVVNRDQDEFNIAKLIVGAQGTLGIVSAVKLRLVPRYRHSRLVVIAADTEQDVVNATQIALTHNPDSVELYDAATYAIAKEYLSEDALHAGFADGKPYILLAQFVEQTKDQTDHYAEVCQKSLERKKFTVRYVTDKREQKAHWNIRYNATKMLREHPHAGKKAAFTIEDTVVAIDHYDEFLRALEYIAKNYPMPLLANGHIGEGNMSFVPLVDMESPQSIEVLFDFTRRVYDLVIAFGGTISGSHGDGIMRTPYLLQMFGPEVMELFAQTKYLFDPLNIFNPGKKVGISEAYAKAHIKRSNSL